MKGAWKILAIIAGAFVALCVFILVAAALFGTDEKKVTSSRESTVITTIETSEVKSDETIVLSDFINRFYEYVIAYDAIPNDSGSKTTAWEEVKGSTVEWSGKVIDSSDDRLYVIADQKYEDGLTWSEVFGTDLAYYVFIAKFEDGKNISNYSNGDQVTLSGILESRGDKELKYNWDIVNSSIN